MCPEEAFHNTAPHSLHLPLLRHFLILPIDVCGCGHVYVEVRVQFVEIASLLPRRGFQGLIAGR